MRHIGRLLKLGLFAMAALVGASGVLVTDGPTTTSAAPSKYTAYTGNGARGIAVNQFMPQSLVITEGDTISWTNPYAEPHTVSFLAGKPRPKDDQALVGAAAPKFDGTDQISSGFMRQGDKYEVTFPKGGSYTLICLVHEVQSVNVSVVSPGMYVPSQAQIDAEAKALLPKALEVGDKMIAAIPPVSRSTNSNGSTSWTIPDSPTMDIKGAAANVTINLFVPQRLQVGVGDTITWLDNTPVPHTVTFLAGGPPKGPPTVPNRPAGGLYDGTGYANSGFMGVAPDRLGGTRFSLTFTQPGTYAYVCILHADQGMAGVIEVGAAGAGAPALRPPATGDAGLAGYGTSAWPLALLVAALGLGSLAVMRVRARA